jgi:NAD(P)-dependent dehydrogenase (short-subunit alcohol dehydrogenase family)
MTIAAVRAMFDLAGKTVVLTGGTGVLGSEMARTLAACDANVVLLGRKLDRAQALIQSFQPSGDSNGGTGRHRALAADVLDRAAVLEAAQVIEKEYGRVDALVNGAGGNDPKATTSPENRFFDVPIESFQQVLNLNLLGTVIPTQAFGRMMAAQKEGVILNVSSVNASRPLTRIAAYSAAKAGISNLTQWLAVHMAQEYSPHIRVNALMPGFFLTEQNRFLLTDQKTGGLTARGQKIMEHTPMARFGNPDDLSGALVWLLSSASRFVTGIVLPIDGGVTAYAGI